MSNRKDGTSEALAIWNALLPKIKAEMDSRMGMCVKRKRATVTVAPHTDANGNRVMTVQEPYGTAFDVPYNPALENQAANTSVWLEWSYSASNMVAVAEGNGTFPASGGGGGGSGDMLKSVYDPNNYSQDIFSYADNAANTAAAAVSVYWATYGTTTNAQIVTANAAGRIVAMKYNNLVYVMDYTNSATYHEFVSVRDDTVYTAFCNNNTWSVSSTVIPAATSDLINDSNFITAAEAPVQSVNGNTGTVVLAASDVGALPDTTTTLPNPAALTFGNNSYDGSAAKTITAADLGIGDVFTIKGSVNQYSDLPPTGNTVGDVYYVEQDETIGGTLYPGQVGYIWITISGTNQWEQLGQTIDVSALQAKITASGILKGDGVGNISGAVAGTDYQTPLPSQTGQSGKFLTTDGTDLSWAAGGGSGTIAATTNILKGDGNGNAIAATEASVSSLSIDNTPTASSPNLVTSGGVYAAIQGGSGSTVYTDSTTIDAIWIQVDPDDPYEHSVFLDNYTVTANTKVDIQPGAAVITQLIADGVKALYIANNNGSLTAYAIDAAPSTSITLQVTCTEVTSA